MQTNRFKSCQGRQKRRSTMRFNLSTNVIAGIFYLALTVFLIAILMGLVRLLG